MVRHIQSTKGFRSNVISFLVLMGLASVLGLPRATAEEPSKASVAEILKNLRETPEILQSRVATLKSRLDRKRAHLAKLNQRLDSARTQTSESIRTLQLSRYSYQAFLVTSRIAAEENKLREEEALLALVPRLDSGQMTSLVKKELEIAASARLQTVERLSRAAEQYRPSITEPALKTQFERLVTSIDADRKQLKGGR